MIGLVGNLVGVVVGFVVVVNIPMAVPSSRVKKEEIVCLIRILCVCAWFGSLNFISVCRGSAYHQRTIPPSGNG
jgi:hypothetical protein